MAYKQRTFISSVVEVGKSVIKAPADSVSREDPLPGS